MRGLSLRPINTCSTNPFGVTVIFVEPESASPQPTTPLATPAPAVAPVAVVPAAPSVPSVVPRVVPEDAHVLRPRLVHDVVGRVWRGRARLDKGRWTIHTPSGVTVLDAGNVARAPLESEVLAEMRERRRDVDRDEPASVLELANWMLVEGLVDEGLNELDRLLEQDERGYGAADLLAETRVPPMLPLCEDAADLERLLDAGARGSPSEQELLVLELVDYGARHRNELRDALLARRGSHRGDGRAFAERALRRLFPGQGFTP